MYQFIESICITEGEMRHTELHQKRIDRTFSHFGVLSKISLQNVFSEIKINDNLRYKLRIVYSLSGDYKAEVLPYEIHEIQDFCLVVNDNINYDFKYSDRSVFNEMKPSAPDAEIIIVKEGCITDTSFSNLIFKKGEDWVTPKGCLLAGVQRQFLLENHLIHEAEIRIENLPLFTHFQIINAMVGMDEGFIYPISKIANLKDFLSLV